MKTKFIKKLLVESIPLDNGKYLTDIGEFYCIDDEFKNELGQNVNGVEWYLLEVPDREDEMRETINLYKECFERFIPTELWDEATEFLSTGNNGLAKDLLRREK